MAQRREFLDIPREELADWSRDEVTLAVHAVVRSKEAQYNTSAGLAAQEGNQAKSAANAAMAQAMRDLLKKVFEVVFDARVNKEDSSETQNAA